MNKIVPCLWFDTQCEEAMNYYVDTFNGAPHKKQESRIVEITRYEKGMEAPGAEQMEGKVITGIFELVGQRYMALDGGPVFNFTEAISFYVECEDQKEVDYFWNKLSAVPEAEQCGWVKDKFGLSWQIIPKQLGELMGDPDPIKSKRVMNAMLKMKKIIVEDLQKAYNNE
ncbi:2-polyprenyl-6-hydroxyphenyl methylase / 3-demethylubiquinone-9 3-methyltransferase [Candidatus Brocadiaceae bacterium]|nr:2-polyprenyl-6-hydroxyphenyl methylase / 3-demethylubiquinone-9 3-methyltransferase [Candidatus Brocadiaceae bacterium]